MSRRWSRNERRLLGKKGVGTSLDELARRLGRSAREVELALQEMGIEPNRREEGERAGVGQVVFAILLALLILVPLIFTRATLESFFFPKLVLIRWSVLAAVAVWLVGWIRRGEAAVRWSPAHLLLGAFLGSLIPSYLMASNRPLARDELLSLLGLVLVWGLSSSVSLDGARKRLAALCLLAAAGLQAVYGLIQYFGADPIFSATPGGRFQIIGTLGNPVFLSTFLAACVPLALSLLFTPTSAPVRVLVALGVGIGSATILVSGTKAAILGAGAAGGLVLLLTLLRRDRPRPRARTAWLAAGAVVLPLVLLFWLPATQTGGFDFVKRLTASLDPSSASMGQRQLLWKATLSMIGERPWFGWGPGHFRLHYLEHQGAIFSVPENAHYLPLAGNPLHPHNDYLEIAVEAGLPSLALFLALVAFVLLRGWNQIRRHGDPLTLGFLGAFVSLLVIALFDFPLHRPSTSLLFWFVGAALVTGSGSNGKWMRWQSPRVVPAVLLVAILALLAGFTRVDFLHYRAETWFARGYAAERSDRLPAAVAHYEKGLALQPRHGQTWLRQGFLFYRSGEWEKAAAALEIGFRERRDAEAHRTLADAYDELGRFDDAIEEYRRAVFLKPDHVSAWNNMGASYYRQGDIASALERWERAAEIAPQHVGSLLNLAVANLELGDKAEALRWARRAAAANPSEADLAKAQLIIQRASPSSG